METKHLDCDVLIIGAGSAGIEAYQAASSAGAYCILAERGPLGTTAQRSGDIPTALLQAAGQCCMHLKDAQNFGLKHKLTTGFDNSEVLNAMRQVRARSTNDILSFIYKIPESQRVIGQVRFLDSNRVTVNEDIMISFKCAVIATGASPAIPYELGRLGGIKTSNDFFEQDRLPKSLAIFGSGLIGLSLGQALSNLGVEVTVFGDGRIWKLTDEQVKAVARELLQHEFSFEVSSELTAIEKVGEGYGIYYLDESRYENFLVVEQVLSAGIRIPNLDELNLRDLGLSYNEHGIINMNFVTMQTEIPHIFAAGDAAQNAMSTARARREGRLAGLNAASFPNLKESVVPCEAAMTFTSPGLAVVGLSLDEMKSRARQGHHFVAAEVRLDDGCYRIIRREGGIIRLYCDEESHLPLGAEICAEGAGHLAHFLTLAMRQKLTVEDLASFDFYHPSLEEAVGKVSLSALKALKRTGKKYYAG